MSDKAVGDQGSRDDPIVLRVPRGRPPPPAFRRDRRRSTDTIGIIDADGSAMAMTTTTRTNPLVTTSSLPTSLTRTHSSSSTIQTPTSISPRDDVGRTSYSIPVPSTYVPCADDDPVSTPAVVYGTTVDGGDALGSTSAIATGASYSSPTYATATVPTYSYSPASTTPLTTSAVPCTSACYLPVVVDERVLPFRYTKGSDGIWQRDSNGWEMFGRVGVGDIAGSDSDSDSDIALSSESNITTSSATTAGVQATAAIGLAAAIPANSTEAYEILTTLPKGWGGTSERSAVYRVPLIIVASLVLAFIMVAFIIIVIVNRAKARKRHAKRKRREARLLAASGGGGAGANASSPVEGEKTGRMSRLLRSRGLRKRKGGMGDAAARADLDAEDDSDGTSSAGMSEKIGAGLRRRRRGTTGGGRLSRAWRSKRTRGREGGDPSAGTTDGKPIPRGPQGLDSGNGTFSDKVVRWRAGMRRRTDHMEEEVAPEIITPEAGRVLETPPDLSTPDRPAYSSDSPPVASPPEPDTTSLHSVAPADTAFITAPVHASFFLPAYRAASVHTPDREDPAAQGSSSGSHARDGPRTLPDAPGGIAGSSHVAGPDDMARPSDMAERAFEKSPARYYSAPTTREQEEALSVAFGVGGGIGPGSPTDGVEGADDAPPSIGPSHTSGAGAVTGHLATDDKHLLERLRNAGSGPSASLAPMSPTSNPEDGTAPALDVDEDGFERLPTASWGAGGPDEPRSVDSAGAGGSMGPALGTVLPAPPRAISQPSYAAFVGNSAPSAPGGVSGVLPLEIPSAPVLYEEEQDVVEST